MGDYRVNDGGPAYPQLTPPPRDGDGLTVRDVYAAHIAAGIVAADDGGASTYACWIADRAYEVADALMVRRALDYARAEVASLPQDKLDLFEWTGDLKHLER